MEVQVDYPAQDFASAGESGDGEAGSDYSASPQTITQTSIIEHLVGIFSETGRIVAKTRVLFHDVKDGTGLTGSEVLTLVAIAHSAGPCTVPQIGRFLGTPRQVVQRAVKVLERDGFVEALANMDHKRAPLIEATAKGRETIAGVDSSARDTISLLAANLSPEAMAAAHVGLIALRERIDRAIGVQED